MNQSARYVEIILVRTLHIASCQDYDLAFIILKCTCECLFIKSFLISFLLLFVGVDLVTTSTAHISSPLFPGRYPRNSHFRWSVVSPSGYRVKIEFSKFDLRYCARCQECDFLRVHDGASPESQVLGTYCSNPGTLYTSGNNVWIEFVASKDLNQVYDSTGFKATLSRGRRFTILNNCLEMTGNTLKNIKQTFGAVSALKRSINLRYSILKFTATTMKFPVL